MFRGREMVHKSRGRDQLEEVLKQLGAVAKLENPPRMEGRFMSMILVGDRETINEIRRAQDLETKQSESTDDVKVVDGPSEAVEKESEPESTETAAE
jgi:hypothetical protein